MLIGGLLVGGGCSIPFMRLGGEKETAGATTTISLLVSRIRRSTDAWLSFLLRQGQQELSLHTVIK